MNLRDIAADVQEEGGIIEELEEQNCLFVDWLLNVPATC